MFKCFQKILNHKTFKGICETIRSPVNNKAEESSKRLFYSGLNCILNNYIPKYIRQIALINKRVREMLLL